MKTTALDTSAVLAFLFDEPGAEKIETLFQHAADADKPMFISAINWAEVLYKMQHKQGLPGLEGARNLERTMPLAVERVDREMAETAAEFKTAHGLALADAFAAALAKHKKAELVTGDMEFKSIEKEVKINWLR
jgi:ribonuclease VapC